MKKTFKEIKEIIDENEITCEDFNNFKYGGKEIIQSAIDILGDIKLVEKYGGEGKGENYWLVFLFVEHDVYMRIDAYYSSDLGVYFDESEMYEVRPKEKTVIVYEP